MATQAQIIAELQRRQAMPQQKEAAPTPSREAILQELQKRGMSFEEKSPQLGQQSPQLGQQSPQLRQEFDPYAGIEKQPSDRLNLGINTARKVARNVGMLERAALGGAGYVADLFSTLPYNAGVEAVSFLKNATGLDGDSVLKLKVDSLGDTILKGIDKITKGQFKPQTGLERVTSDVTSAVSPILMAGALPKAATTLSESVPQIEKGASYLYNLFLEPSAQNIIGTAGAAGAASLAKEAGFEAGGQMAAGLVGGLVGASAPSLAKGIASTAAKTLPESARSIPQEERLLTARGQGLKPNEAEIQRRQALSESTGVPMDIGELTGNQGIRAVSDALANGVEAGRYGQRNLDRANTLIKEVEKVSDKIQKDKVPTGIKFADDFREDFRGIIDKAVELRRSQGRNDFSKVSDKTTIMASELFDELTGIARQYENRPVPRNLRGFMNDIQNEINFLLNKQKNMSPKDLAYYLSAYGKRGLNTGAWAKDLGNAQAAMISARLKNAIERDLDEALTDGLTKGVDVENLRTARENYRKNSEVLQELDQSFLSGVFGDKLNRPPEDILRSFSTMSESEARNAMQVLQKHNPDLIPQLQKFYIDSNLERARSFGRRGGQEALSETVQMQNLPAVFDQKTIGALFGANSVLSKKMKDVMDTVQILKEYSARSGGSPTASRQSIERALKGEGFTLPSKKIFDTIMSKFSDYYKDPEMMDTAFMYTLLHDPKMIRKIADGTLTAQEAKEISSRQRFWEWTLKGPAIGANLAGPQEESGYVTVDFEEDEG